MPGQGNDDGDSGGWIFEILPPTFFDFTNIATSHALTLPIGQRIATSGAPEVTLVARLHGATNMATAGQTLVCRVMLDAFTEDDPAGQFRTALNNDCSLTFTGAITAAAVAYAGTSIAANNANAFGSHIGVNLVATQPPAGGTFQVVLSITAHFKGGRRSRSFKRREFMGYA